MAPKAPKTTIPNRRASLGAVNRKLRFDANMDDIDILQRVKEARDNPQYTVLIFDEVEFDNNLAAAVIDMLRATASYGRVWERINMEFCEGPVDMIISAATMLNCIKHLFLASDEKQDETISRFSTMLRINTSLQSVWLLVPFTETSAAHLGEALAVNDTLDKLSVSGSTWDPDALDDDDEHDNPDPMMKNSIAESIDTIDTMYTADSAALALAKGLGQNTSLRTIDLSCCSLQDDAMSTVLACLIGHPALQVLDISRNKCRERSMAALANIVRHDYSQLKNIDVREQTEHNPLDISRLALALKNNDTLEVLKLSHNRLTDLQVVELVRALNGNGTLQELDLQWNQITEKGLNVLTKHLNELSALAVLLLGGNAFGQQGKDILESLEDDDESICTINEEDLYHNQQYDTAYHGSTSNMVSGTIMSGGILGGIKEE